MPNKTINDEVVKWPSKKKYMSKEKILEEYKNRFGKRKDITTFNDEYSREIIYLTKKQKEVSDWISKAIAKTREETIREVEYNLPLEYHPDGDSEKGYNACLGEIKITLNKLKK